MREVLDFTDLKASGILPSPKGVALKVMQLCQDEALSLKELAQTIQADPVLAGRIIKIANYVNPNRSRPIASVTTDTLILIGIHAVRQVVLGLSLVGSYRSGQCKNFDYEQFWSHSVAMGSAAHAIGSVIHVAAPAEMFNCGLMSGIGQLTLVTVRPDAYSDMLSTLPDTSTTTLYEAQLDRFGTTQREMMMFMLQDWGIPKLFIDALYFHENPSSSGYADHSRPLRITYTLKLASLLAEACMSDDTDELLQASIDEFGTLLELTPEQLQGIAEQTKKEWQEWCSILEVRHKNVPKKPAKVEPPSAEMAAPTTSSLEETVISSGKTATPLRILIASSNETQRSNLHKLIQSLGHTVNVVNSGSDALLAISKLKPQVLIADWLLPELDGLTLCKKIRSTPETEKIYCMVVSQFEDDRRKVEAYLASADCIVQSPVNPRLLLAQLTVAQRYIKMLNVA